MPKPIPLPAEVIYNSKGWMTGDILTRGAIMSFLLPWWLAGCQPIDLSNNARLRELIPIDDSRWARKRNDIRIALEALILTLGKLYKKAMVSQANIAKRNQIGANALAEYRLKKFGLKKNINNQAIAVSSSLLGNINDYKLYDNDDRVDTVLPYMISGHGEHTPNSFKNRPEKLKGMLKDK